MSRRRREINIYKIAEEAGVSASTVSRVVNNRIGVNEETRISITELLKKYGFTPDYPRQRPPKIAFVSPWDDLTEYFRKGFQGVYRYCQKHEIDVNILIRSSHDNHTLLEKLRDQQCSGAIVMLGENLQKEHLELSSSGMPVIFLDSPVNLANVGYIDHDAYSGSCAATQHLLELGHKAIGYLTFPEPSINQFQRFKGYENTMKAAGLPINPRWIVSAEVLNKTDGRIRGLRGFRAMTQLLQDAPEITAVMTVDDNMAFGAMTAISRSGRHIPEDISVVGFDNYAETEMWFTALTTVNHPIAEAGVLAAKAIDQALRHPGSGPLIREILPTKLIIRQSTGPVRANR
jgi:LacI family transcriptional regulator